MRWSKFIEDEIDTVDKINWHASYQQGYEHAYLLWENHVHVNLFLRQGSRERRRLGWYWRPYMMGFRDGRADWSNRNG